MAATPLPSSGAVSPEPKTCDASGMAEIHRMFLAGFREGPSLVRGVRTGNTAHAEVVATQLDLLSSALHAHHDGEDERLWGALVERSPACTVHVERMKQHHAAMLAELTAMDAALPAWRASATSATAAPLLAALDGINGALAIHLPDEEQNIVPVMERTITQKEVEWFSEHGRASTPKGQTWNALGAIVSSQPDGGDAWLRKNLPAPVRVMWRWVGKPRYERTRAALEGR
ncbi:hemerythrin domain-containing protein [Microbacterium sp. NPDC055910]|uniref:hemerythrin domain-containing protein n=1 Tax=Microbacterium sp. NPDC055910 TaxID=3345659 RepID=UPI0035DC3AE5